MKILRPLFEAAAVAIIIGFPFAIYFGFML
jgi:hypothetical protein